MRTKEEFKADVREILARHFSNTQANIDAADEVGELYDRELARKSIVGGGAGIGHTMHVDVDALESSRMTDHPPFAREYDVNMASMDIQRISPAIGVVEVEFTTVVTELAKLVPEERKSKELVFVCSMEYIDEARKIPGVDINVIKDHQIFSMPVDQVEKGIEKMVLDGTLGSSVINVRPGHDISIQVFGDEKIEE